MKIYLSHRLEDKEAVRIAQQYMESEKDELEFLNPFYDSEYEEATKCNNRIERKNSFSKDDCEKLVREDKKLIEKSDAVLCYVQVPSVGTLLEMGYTYDETDKPLIFISENHIDHPWVRVYSDSRFSSFKEFLDWVENIDVEEFLEDIKTK